MLSLKWVFFVMSLSIFCFRAGADCDMHTKSDAGSTYHEQKTAAPAPSVEDSSRQLSDEQMLAELQNTLERQELSADNP